MRAGVQQSVLPFVPVSSPWKGEPVRFQGRSSSGEPTKRCILDAANTAQLPSEPHLPPESAGRFFRKLLNVQKRLRNWTAGLLLAGVALSASAPLLITSKIQATKAPYGVATKTEDLPFSVQEYVRTLEIERLVAGLFVVLGALGACAGMRVRQKEVQEALALLKNWENGRMIEDALEPAENAAERHLKQRFEQKVTDLYTQMKPLYAKSFPSQKVVDRLFRYLGTQYLQAQGLGQVASDGNEPRLTKRAFYQAALTMAELATLRGNLFEALQYSDDPDALEGQAFRPALARVAAFVHSRVGQEADRYKELFREQESLRRTLERHDSQLCEQVLEEDEKVRILNRLAAVEVEMKSPPPLVSDQELESLGLTLPLEQLAVQQEYREESFSKASGASLPSVETLSVRLDEMLQELAESSASLPQQNRAQSKN